VLETVPRPWAARRFWDGDGAYQQHAVVSMNGSLHVKRLHGIVPVEADGSAQFYVPAMRNIYFQALDENYKKGFRLFELDIIETSDGKLVAAHDWKMWARFTDYTGTLPPTLAEFKKHKIYGDYETLDVEGVNDWFAAHPDATLITDKVNDPIAFAKGFVDSKRLIMELFSLLAIEEASQNGINTIISQEPLLAIKGDKLTYLAVNNIKYVAVSRRIIASNTKLLLQLRDQGIKVYVYNVNFDSGKDENYVQENEIGLVYGMYADKWVFDKNLKSLSK
ncbi:hypothetical protein LCGC14_0841780, partial [marine sediment metagenome]